MSKQARKGKPMPWFKCWFFQWDTDEVAALDLETTGFLHLLKLRMAERRSPLPEQFLPHVARGKRLNKRSIERMLKTLIGYGLIVRENGLIWNEDIAEDIDGFFDVSQKFDQSFAKVSPEQRQKTQRNQCDASTEIEGDKEGYGRPHKGGVQDIDGENSSYSSGPASANAGRPDIGEEEERFFAGDAPSFDGREDFAAGDPPTADEAHSFFAEAFEALCASGDDPSFADQNTTADAALVEHRRTILRCRRDDDGLSPTERDLLKQWQQKLDDGASLTIAEVDELQNIANFLDLSDDADADDAGWPRQNSNSSQKETVR